MQIKYSGNWAALHYRNSVCLLTVSDVTDFDLDFSRRQPAPVSRENVSSRCLTNVIESKKKYIAFKVSFFVKIVKNALKYTKFPHLP